MVNDGSANRSGSRNQNIADFWKLIKPLILVEKFPRNEGIWSTSEGADFIERYISLLCGLFFENAFAHGDRTKLSQLTLFPRWSRSIWITAWEQRKLGDVATIVGGGTPSTNNDAYWDGDIDWYSPAELGEQVYADRSVRRITQAGYDSCSATLLPAGKTILFTSRAGIGNTAILRRSACTNQGFQSLVVNDDTDVYFVYSMTDRIKKFAEQKASGSTFLEISGKGLAAGEFAFPSKDEQTAIGSMFKQLDHLITLHQCKCQHCSLCGYLSWEQRKLGNCGATYGGLTGKTKEDFGHGNARFIPYTNVFDNPLTDTKRLEAVEIDSSQNQVAYGDVLFTVSSETPDEVGMSSVWLSDQENVYLNSFCFGYRQDSTFDPHYLAYMLRSSSVRSNLALLAQGISRFNISKNKVMELTVPVPSAVEQKELGQYFTKLDHLITLHR